MAGLPELKHLVKTTHKEEYPSISPTNPANSAKGKTVFVTGGATGIGYATARAFALAGASTVIIVARRPETLKEKAAELSAEVPSANILTYPLDITNESAVKDVFHDLRQNRLPTDKDIDILVLSAATIDLGTPALSYTPAQLHAAFSTNVFGNLNVVGAFLAPVDAAASNSTTKVVLDVSTHSVYERYPIQALYSASKAAFTQYMRHVAAEYADSGVRVHSFHPGGVKTDAVRRAGYGELVYPWDDVSLPAGLAVWLASPAAAFLSGRFVLSNWDVDELVALKGAFERDADLGKIVLKVKPDA